MAQLRPPCQMLQADLMTTQSKGPSDQVFFSCVLSLTVINQKPGNVPLHIQIEGGKGQVVTGCSSAIAECCGWR